MNFPALYYVNSEMTSNFYDSSMDYNLPELGMGKGLIAEPPTFDTGYGYPLFPAPNLSFESLETPIFSDFQGSFESSPNSSNPNSPASSIHSEISDQSLISPVCDQNLFGPHHLPSPYVLSENRYLRDVNTFSIFNKKKRSIDDIYYLPSESIHQGDGVINELFANGGEPFEFQNDSSASSETFLPYSLMDQSSMNIFNSCISQSSTASSSQPINILNTNNNTKSIGNNNSSTNKSKASTASVTTRSSTKNIKKGRRLSNSSKGKSGIPIKKENSNTSNVTDQKSLQQLGDVIDTLDSTMKGVLTDGLKHLAELAGNGLGRDISSFDAQTELLKISMVNSVMGMLYPRLPTILPPNSQSNIPYVSLKSDPLSSAFVFGSNGSSFTTPANPFLSSCTKSLRTPSYSVKKDPAEDVIPTNKRKKARSSPQSSKASQQNFRFSVVNANQQRLPVQQTATAIVTVL
jgi:hypothetical protein